MYKVKGMVAFMKGQKNNRQQAKTLKKVLKYIEKYKIFLALSLCFAPKTLTEWQGGISTLLLGQPTLWAVVPSCNSNIAHQNYLFKCKLALQ